MILKYKIKFFDYWHLSSGISAGARLDSAVVKDKYNLPYVPAKSIKGLTREMAELLDDNEFVNRCFGEEGVKNGKCYFANAVLNKTTQKEIISNNIQDNLYDVIASTQIGKNGIAVDNSLREIEVVVPIELEGEILDIEKNDIENMKKSLQMIKRMGLNRNRGLGRCEFSDFEVEEQK
jgi:CRISPR/Cas system CSM-associated protein Csm3 (group 7 of RAMP superfamily)